MKKNLEVCDEEHESKKDQVYVVAKQEPKMTPQGESVIADPPFQIPEDPAVADLGAGTGDSWHRGCGFWVRFRFLDQER